MDYIAESDTTESISSQNVGISTGCVAVVVIMLIAFYCWQRTSLRLSQDDSEMLGVSLAYLLNDFETDAEEAILKEADRKQSLWGFNIEKMNPINIVEGGLDWFEPKKPIANKEADSKQRRQR